LSGRLPLAAGAVLLAFGFCAVCAAGTNAPSAADGRSIRFDLEGRLVFLRADLGDSRPHRLILDTGATETLLTPPVAASLGLIRGSVPSGGTRARLPHLGFAGVVLRDVAVLVYDPPQALPLRIDQGIDYHGIVGSSVLSRYTVVLDYPAGTVALRTGGRGAQEPAGAIPFDGRDGLVRVEGWIGVQGPFRLLIDTGAAESVFSRATARAAGLALRPSGGTGPDRATAPVVRVGGVEVRDLPAIVDDLPSGRTVRGWDGILGFGFLSRFRVTIAYPRSRLWLERDDRAVRPSPAP
jgi:predicted aspartyl protease